jgi:sugar lactone lactonase YvrE
MTSKSLSALFLVLASLGQAEPVPLRSIPVGPNPESVTRGFGGDFFVTLMGPTRTKGDGNGRIVRINGDTVTDFATGFDDPKGLVFVGDSLVTADFDQVWRIDAAGRKTLLAGPGAFPTPPLFLNDVAVAPDGRGVLITDMGAATKMRGPDGKLWPLDSAEAKALPALGRVYRIGLDGAVTIAADRDPLLVCPNGVAAPDAGTLLVAEFFTGRILAREAAGWRILAEGHRSADAIERGRDGTLYVSEVVTGHVWALAPAGGKTRLATLSSAADFFLDEANHRLLVPDTKAGTLVLVPLRSP